jgi:hypothetical protein
MAVCPSAVSAAAGVDDLGESSPSLQNGVWFCAGHQPPPPPERARIQHRVASAPRQGTRHEARSRPRVRRANGGEPPNVEVEQKPPFHIMLAVAEIKPATDPVGIEDGWRRLTRREPAAGVRALRRGGGDGGAPPRQIGEKVATEGCPKIGSRLKLRSDLGRYV